MLKTSTVLALISTLCNPSWADELIPASSSPATKKVLESFVEMSKIFRPSRKEEAIRNYVQTIATRHGLVSKVDPGGSLIVQVPATKGVSFHPSSVALQAHLDMVLDADLTILNPGETLEDLFLHGVDLVSEDGWIHSRDYKTTIGGDDGLGVGMMLRYMTDPQVKHPALELIFTTDEEAEVTGARDLQYTIRSPYLINLDGLEYPIVFIGCMGSRDVAIHYNVKKKAKVPPKAEFLEIKLGGLQGGHSGGDIHKGRGNSVKLLAELLKNLGDSVPDFLLVKAAAGTEKIYNKIPSSFVATIAVPSGGSEKAKQVAEEFQKSIRERFKMVEIAEEIQLNIAKVSSDARHGLPTKTLANLIDILIQIPDGVVIRNPTFQDGLELVSNLGLLFVSETKSGYSIETGVMPRSFTDPALIRFMKELPKRISRPGLTAKSTVVVDFPSWQPNPKSKLLAKFLEVGSQYDKFQVRSVPGGLEAAYFVQKYPKLEIISIGNAIRDAHSRKESFDLTSLEKTIALLDALLASFEKR